jgi:hypothetical protein
MCYNYWNGFIDQWKRLPLSELTNRTPAVPFHPFLGWDNPNLQPLMNSSSHADCSLKYLPEPWWGNNGRHILNSVVINYNPGEASSPQSFVHSSGLYGYPDYSSFVNSEAKRITSHFPGTRTWHNGQRATRIFNTLKRLGFPLTPTDQLHNHLSIELIPWHTENTGSIGTYINHNLNMIYEHSFVFAADQSRRIANPLLNNKVILRLSGAVTLDLLNNMVKLGFGLYIVLIPPNHTTTGPAITAKGKHVTGSAGYFKFTFNAIPDIEFISIWDITGGNAFPPDGDMDWIFTHII